MGKKVIEGKTKVLTIHSEDEDLVRITTKDSLTGNDGELKSELPLAKAKTSQTCNIFQILRSAGVPVSYVERLSDTEFLAHNCKMLPLECVLRRRPWGSYLKRHNVKDPENNIFNSPIVEFYLKAVNKPFKSRTHTVRQVNKNVVDNITEVKHIEMWTGETYSDPIIYIHNDMFSMNDSNIDTHESVWYMHPPKMRFSPTNFEKIEPIADYETMEYIEHELMRPTFRLLEGYWKKFNVDLIDLKIEVGYTSSGKLVVADVIDNDSWRIWPNGDHTHQLDKQLFREGGSEADVIHNYEKVADLTNRMREHFYRVGG
jgi:phosphoribosylaminoimidazole-succinocarboxamide synthase